jgi:excisionase family DNA binding protein
LVSRNIQSPWLTLSDASSLLGVHPSTLRRWADGGRVPCQRTPGGHRRFQRDHLLPVINGGSFDQIVAGEPPAPEDLPWHASFAAAGQVDVVREIGQRLSGIALQHLLREDDDRRHLDEARSLGQRYAAAARSSGVEILTSVEAFLYYSASLLPIVGQSSGGEHLEHLRQFTRYHSIVGQALLGLVDGYRAE